MFFCQYGPSWYDLTQHYILIHKQCSCIIGKVSKLFHVRLQEFLAREGAKINCLKTLNPLYIYIYIGQDFNLLNNLCIALILILKRVEYICIYIYIGCVGSFPPNSLPTRSDFVLVGFQSGGNVHPGFATIPTLYMYIFLSLNVKTIQS